MKYGFTPLRVFVVMQERREQGQGEKAVSAETENKVL